MKNNWIRFLAGALASVVLVGIFALTGGMKGGKSTNGLLYQASGLHPDGEMLVINGQTISCEEYLFWLGVSCQNVASGIPDVDWNAAVSEGGITYGEYAKIDAIEGVKPYAVLRAWAQQEQVDISEADRAMLADQRQQYVDYYGGEEAYLQQIALLGVSEETNDRILEAAYLYRAMYQAFCTPGTSLYADDKTLTDYAAQQGYMGAYVIKLTGDNAATMAGDLLDRWQAAEDKESEYLLICDELRQTADGLVTLMAMEGDGLSDAIAPLAAGDMTAVIDPYGEGTCFVVLRADVDLTTVAETYFDALWNEKVADAVVVTNSKLYDPLDAGAFYEKLLQLRTDMLAAMEPADAQPDTGDDQTDGTGEDQTPEA